MRQHITPILINRETDLVQFLKDDYTYLAVEIIRGDTINYALLEIPSDKVPRFVNSAAGDTAQTQADDPLG
ncbi:polyphosphate kinase [Salmonella enterica subsp. enterica]|uniref:Polyphosphate kinase n=1 Tax=Salmonella enterica I TaxID=59201 RepID=A0A447TY59_SALET|nr:polyphosphate kinase [Salmonella enterica subsp. enterica]